MSTSKDPLRGDAAWKAAKREIADRNEAAYARGRRERVARNAAWAKQRNDAEREANAQAREAHARRSPSR